MVYSNFISSDFAWMLLSQCYRRDSESGCMYDLRKARGMRGHIRKAFDVRTLVCKETELEFCVRLSLCWGFNPCIQGLLRAFQIVCKEGHTVRSRMWKRPRMCERVLPLKCWSSLRATEVGRAGTRSIREYRCVAQARQKDMIVEESWLRG